MPRGTPERESGVVTQSRPKQKTKPPALTLPPQTRTVTMSQGATATITLTAAQRRRYVRRTLTVTLGVTSVDARRVTKKATVTIKVKVSKAKK